MKKYYYSTVVALLYIPLVTILAELYKPLKDFLAGTFWHHWLGKGVVLILLYAVSLLAFSRTGDTEEDGKFVSWITGLTLVGGLSILAFFVFEYAKHL